MRLHKLLLAIVFTVIFMPILIVGICRAVGYVSSLCTSNKTFRIPEAGLYVRMVYKARDGFGTLYLSDGGGNGVSGDIIRVENDKLCYPLIRLLIDTCADRRHIYIDDAGGLVRSVQSDRFSFTLLPSRRDSAAYFFKGFPVRLRDLLPSVRDSVFWLVGDTLRADLTLGKKGTPEIDVNRLKGECVLSVSVEKDFKALNLKE